MFSGKELSALPAQIVRLIAVGEEFSIWSSAIPLQIFGGALYSARNIG